MSSAAAALRYWERRQEVSSNNLANVSTEGFKGQRVFSRMVEGGLPAAEATTNFAPGALHSTGNPYDVALEGRNFLVVNTANGERLSRGGTLHVNQNGVLVDAAGNTILGDNGEIRVTSRNSHSIGKLDIARNGEVRVDNDVVGRLRIETIPDNTSLAREGAGLFVPPSARTTVAGDTTAVQQGTLEDSNVTPISEMVDMIAIQRAYTAVQKAMTTLDGARGIATTELGKPAN